MRTATASLAIGVLLIAVGVWAYASSQPGASPTALIPAAIGLVLVVCGVVARRGGAAEKHAMHAAAAVALLGALGSVGQLIARPASDSPAAGIALIAGLLNLVLCAAFVAVAVRTFVATRRERRRQPA